jgi:hypothetical protein
MIIFLFWVLYYHLIKNTFLDKNATSSNNNNFILALRTNAKVYLLWSIDFFIIMQK